MAKKFCTGCGAPLEQAARFCDGCGSGIVGATPISNGPSRRPFALAKSRVVIGLGTVALAAMGVGYWWMHSPGIRIIALRTVEADGKQPRCLLIDENGKLRAEGDAYPGISPNIGDWMAVSSIDARGLPNGVRYIDSSGAQKIAPIQFPGAIETPWRGTSFSSHGLAGLQIDHGGIDGSWGIIDRSGKFVSEKRFNNFIMLNDDLAAFQEGAGGDWGLIDWQQFKRNPEGYIYSAQFRTIEPVPGAQLTAVGFGSHSGAPGKWGDWGFINPHGDTVVDAEYDRASSGFNPKYFAVKKDGRWGVLAIDGSEKISPRFDGVILLLPEGRGAFAVVLGQTIQWIDDKGNVLKSVNTEGGGLYFDRGRPLFAFKEMQDSKPKISIYDGIERVDWKFPNGMTAFSFDKSCQMKPVQ